MHYEQTVAQKITYNQEDIIGWIKTFGAKQLNVPEEELVIEPSSLEDIKITVSHIKTTGNKKED